MKATETIERIFAEHLGESWRHSASYGCGLEGVIAQAAMVFPGERIEALRVAIRAAWEDHARDAYRTARAYAACSSRLFGRDEADRAAIDARRMAAFDAIGDENDWVRDYPACPV